MIVRELAGAEYGAAVPRLAEILVDAVDSGAGVTFMHPLAQEVAEAYWMKQKADVASGQTTVFVADENGVIAGTVMLQKVWPPNQPHRCEVAKLLVHREFRRRGLATSLMQALEAKARASGFKLITFDAVAKSPAEALYRQLGFTCAGYIPNYAYAKGKLDGTALFYKEL
jgi:ribosomal protein S18 acetylase RimI-like enzyme